MYDSTLRLGYVDGLDLDVLAAPLDGRRRQREEARQPSATLGDWSDFHTPKAQIFNARLGGRDEADLAEKSARVVFVFASKDDQVPLEVSIGIIVVLYRPVRKTTKQW